ncbi:MAG: hypothetical protein V1859_04830 [archaeon]
MSELLETIKPNLDDKVLRQLSDAGFRGRLQTAIDVMDEQALMEKSYNWLDEIINASRLMASDTRFLFVGDDTRDIRKTVLNVGSCARYLVERNEPNAALEIGYLMLYCATAIYLEEKRARHFEDQALFDAATTLTAYAVRSSQLVLVLQERLDKPILNGDKFTVEDLLNAPELSIYEHVSKAKASVAEEHCNYCRRTIPYVIAINKGQLIIYKSGTTCDGCGAPI